MNDVLTSKPIHIAGFNTPDKLNFVMRHLNPPNSLPDAAWKLESYIRLKSLPDELIRIVTSYLVALDLSNKVFEQIPSMPKVKPNFTLSGSAELKWKFDDNSIFSILISNVTQTLKKAASDPEIEVGTKFSYLFVSPLQGTDSGEFKSMEEALDTITKSFIP